MVYKELEWHEEGLRNMLRHLKGRRVELTDLNLKVDRLEKEYNLLSKQIQKAKENGKAYFDSDKYLVKNKRSV